MRHEGLVSLCMGMTLLMMSADALAAPGPGCRPFVDHVLRSQGFGDLNAVRRMNSSVEDGGENPALPYISVNIKSEDGAAKKFMLEAYPESESGRESRTRWSLKMVRPPMKDYVFHLRLEEGVCGLESIEVIGRPRIKREKCDPAAVEQASANLKPYLKEACAMGRPFFKDLPSKKEREPRKRGRSNGGAASAH